MILADEVLRAGLAPLPRRWETLPDHRFAAVLAAIVRIDGADHLLFTERHADLPEHPGQIAFPGGARDGEEDPVTCALRESEEEIGLLPAEVTTLGALPNRTSSSAFRVHPIVARIPGMERLRPDPREVESIFAVPFAELCDETRWEDREVLFAGKHRRKSPHFEHAGHTIWGLTGRFTRDLVAAVHSTSGS